VKPRYTPAPGSLVGALIERMQKVNLTCRSRTVAHANEMPNCVAWGIRPKLYSLTHRPYHAHAPRFNFQLWV